MVFEDLKIALLKRKLKKAAAKKLIKSAVIDKKLVKFAVKEKLKRKILKEKAELVAKEAILRKKLNKSKGKDILSPVEKKRLKAELVRVKAKAAVLGKMAQKGARVLDSGLKAIGAHLDKVEKRNKAAAKKNK